MLESKGVHNLLAKIKDANIPLVEYAGTKPLRGILTGFNEAFLIDTSQKDRLIKNDFNCADLIKPYLRGQDAKRWSPAWDGLWIILLKSSSNAVWPWSGVSDPEQAEIIFRKTYPSIYFHLKPWESKLKIRQDKGKHWWELRSCSYYDAFEGNKIIWPDLGYHSRFCYNDGGHIAEVTCFALPSSDAWLLAALNSPLMWAWLWRNTIHGKDEVLRLKNIYTEQIPIANASDLIREKVTELAGRLIEITKQQQTTRRDLLDWLRVQYEVAEPSQKLQAPTGLDSDAFITEVQKLRGKAHPLTSAGLKALREEYARSVEPARALAAEAAALERSVSDLVNEAYGLTPEEVRLMWDTAPPRMPIAPP